MNTYRAPKFDLLDNEVFVFGANRDGFHGAGAAGFASFGEFGNVWRKYYYGSKSNGWQGNWNVKGVSEGFQEGKIGKSYAIPTVVKPGLKRSIPLSQISKSIDKFYEFATTKLGEYIFFVAQNASNNNLNGYSSLEMAEVWGKDKVIPNNIFFEEEFAKLMIL